jgi:hypothetical protein
MENRLSYTTKVDITKEQFEIYLQVQKSGVTNMFDITYVKYLTGLEREEIMAIMKNYRQLESMYL